MCLAVRHGLLVRGHCGIEFGARGSRVAGIPQARLTVLGVAQFGQASSQFVDDVIADQRVGRGVQLLAGGDQLATTFVKQSCRRHIHDPRLRQRRDQNLLGRFEFGLCVRRRSTWHHPRAQQSRQFDVGRRADTPAPGAARLDGHGVTVETHLDVGDRDEFDVGGGEFGLAGGPLDREGCGLDGTHRVIGQRDACELAVRAVELTPRGVELGETGLEPVGLVAVGHLLDRAAGGVDAGLGCLNRGARFAGRGLGRLLHFSGGGELVEGFGRCRLQPRNRGGPLVDVGTQPSPFGECCDRCGVGGVRGGGNHLGLFELLGQRSDRLGRGAGLGEALSRIGPVLGEP